MLTLDLSPNGDPEAVTKQLDSFKIQDGDQIHIFPIASYNEKAIYLQGHVLRPGRYSYRDGMTLKDLIASYGDLLPEPAALCRNYPAEPARLPSQRGEFQSDRCAGQPGSFAQAASPRHHSHIQPV